jgi:hypothetical protein
LYQFWNLLQWFLFFFKVLKFQCRKIFYTNCRICWNWFFYNQPKYNEQGFLKKKPKSEIQNSKIKIKSNFGAFQLPVQLPEVKKKRFFWGGSNSYISYHCVAKHTKERFKIYIYIYIYLVYSQIWLNLCKNYHHNSYIFQWDDRHLPTNKNSLKKNTDNEKNIVFFFKDIKIFVFFPFMFC